MDNSYDSVSAVNTYPPVTPQSAALGVGMILFLSVLVLAIYIYAAYCLTKIGKKTNTPNAWMAYVPIANIFYMVQIARVSMWWVLAMFVPVLNIVAIVYVWMKIAESVRRPSWWGILMIINPVNLVLLWFMAFRDGSEAPVIPPTPYTPPVAPTPPTPPVAPAA